MFKKFVIAFMAVLTVCTVSAGAVEDTHIYDEVVEAGMSYGMDILEESIIMAADAILHDEPDYYAYGVNWSEFVRWCTGKSEEEITKAAEEALIHYCENTEHDGWIAKTYRYEKMKTQKAAREAVHANGMNTLVNGMF